MYSNKRRRRTSLVVVFVVGTAIILLILALALSAGESGNLQNNDRNTPQQVHDRAVDALRTNNLQTLYEELSPSIKEMIPPESFTLVQTSNSGPITIELLEPPQIKPENPWNGEWADARIRVARNGIVEEYVVRYHLEDGGWWLYATLKVN